MLCKKDTSNLDSILTQFFVVEFLLDFFFFGVYMNLQ